jgi:uncharacterized protein
MLTLPARRDQHQERSRRQPAPVAGDLRCLVLGVGVALLVGADGSPGWQRVRVLLTVAGCLALAAAPRVLPRRAAAVAGVVAGAVLTPAGTTIGVSHLAAAGLSAKAVGGVLTAAGGLAVLVAGAVTLIRAARGWHRLLAVPVVLLAGYATVLPLSIAVYATNLPRPQLGTATPAGRGLTYRDATFRTADGVTLSGWYLPAANRAAVVLLHGASSTRTDVLDQAAVLARHGYGVLLFDARGHGRSGGRAMDFGWYGDADVAAAVGYLAQRPEVDPGRIGAVGMSMGGEEAIGAMAAEPRIRATVAEGATNRSYADTAWLGAAYGTRGRIQQGVEWLTYGVADLLTAASPPLPLRAAVHAAAPRPVLLIAAGGNPDEARADRYIQAGSPATVQLWVVPGAAHTGGLRSRPGEWQRRVTAFLDGALLGPVVGHTPGGPIRSIGPYRNPVRVQGWR